VVRGRGCQPGHANIDSPVVKSRDLVGRFDTVQPRFDTARLGNAPVHTMNSPRRGTRFRVEIKKRSSPRCHANYADSCPWWPWVSSLFWVAASSRLDPDIIMVRIGVGAGTTEGRPSRSGWITRSKDSASASPPKSWRRSTSIRQPDLRSLTVQRHAFRLMGSGSEIAFTAASAP
jgi:hypothetical protein